jgi:hypothetical protein
MQKLSILFETVEISPVPIEELKKKKSKQLTLQNYLRKYLKSATIWHKHVQKVHEFGHTSYSGNFLEIKYEDLLIFPESTVKKILQFLNLEFSDDLLQFYEHQTNKKLEPQEFLAWKEQIFSPINATNQGMYKKQLNCEEIKAFENIAKQSLGTIQNTYNSRGRIHTQ